MLETVRARWREYLSATTLARHAGVGVEGLARAAAKELIDNAHDASPTGIDVTIEDRRISVRDYGSGLSEAKVVELFAVRRDAISSKRWRQARRGALGNGLRVVIGVAYCSGGSLVVESRGVRLALEVDVDGNASIIDRQPSDIHLGTCVTLEIGPGLAFDRPAIEQFAKLAQAVSGTAFGGSKAVPQWFDPASLIELIRDVDPATSVMEFARQFDLTPDALATIKTRAMRLTTRALLDDAERLDDIVWTILFGGREPRQLKPLGRSTFEGAYNRIDDVISLGSTTELPIIVEVWTRGYPVRDRRSSGKVGLAALYANRTPALGLRGGGTGRVEPPTFDFSIQIENVEIEIPAEDSGLKGPCEYWFTLAITTPELPLISEGKALDVLAFGELIAEAITPTLKRAYKPPQQTLAATKPPKSPRPEPEPHTPGKLGTLNQKLAAATGHDPDRLLVLSKDYDPYGLDTPANRRRAEWLADAMQAVGIATRTIHIRGIFYALVAAGNILRDDGKPFTNTDANYGYLQRIARHARWLQVIDPTLIIDERNTPPIIRLAEPPAPPLDPKVGVAAPELIVPASRGELRIDLGDEPIFPARPQPFHLVLFGEKTGLDPVLGPLAERFGASLFLPSGEVSNTMLRQMAEVGSDRRRLIVFTFTDFDPTGNNMPCLIAQKLRAFRDLEFADLHFEVRPVTMLEEQVRSLNLPSTPLKETEKRAPEWVARYPDLEQTEVDALATLQPDVLIDIAEAAIAPFFDADLERRQQEAEAEWLASAEVSIAAIDTSSLAPYEARMAAEIGALKVIAARFNEAGRNYREAAEELVAEVNFPAFEPPNPETDEDNVPEPLVASDWETLEFIDTLRARMIRVKKGRKRRGTANGDAEAEEDDDEDEDEDG